MRFHLVLLALAAASLSSADRLISTPTGRKIPFGTVRAEAMAEVSRGRHQEYFLGAGITPYFDLELRSQYIEGVGKAATFDLGYNYISPIPDLSPGFSAGVQDALDETEDGRRFYGAMTLRPLFSTINGDIAADFTVGVYLGSYTAPFVGGTIPFSREVRVLYEYNGIRLATGFEARLLEDLALRLIYREQDVLGSIQFTRRF